MRVTIRDIAKLAGVSHMTVSRVINNDPMVSPETRRKVLDVIEQRNYTPHLSARALISGETKVLGVLILYDINFFPADFLTTILVGISSGLEGKEYHLSLHFDQLNQQHELVPNHLLTTNRMDGLFVISTESRDKLAKRLAGLSLPMVVINQQIDIPGVSCVDSDDYGGAYAVMSHLLGNGRRDIAFIGGDPLFDTSALRYKAYKAALAEFGLEADPDMYSVGYFSGTGGYKAAKDLLASGKKIDAIFAANDLMALGALGALNEAGRAVPGDVALAGFDDEDFASALFPPLTTVRKNRARMGADAAGIMLASIERSLAGKKPKVERKTLPTEFIERQSSGGRKPNA